MRKPQDPRHHGLKEPDRVIKRTAKIEFSSEPTLQSLISGWNKALKDHLAQEHRITDGPNVKDEGSYSYKRMTLTYTYEFENRNYAVEKVEYDTAISNYEEQLTKFLAKEEKEKSHIPNLDEKIAKTEKRLANLKAHKAGQPLPFPEQ
jgi:hypothetical protein